MRWWIYAPDDSPAIILGGVGGFGSGDGGDGDGDSFTIADAVTVRL